MNLFRRWETLILESVPSPPGSARIAESFQRLDDAYCEAHRAYHTWQHVEECLEWLDRYRSSIADDASSRASLEYALFYHDIVYQPNSPDNEMRSALIAQAELASLGLSHAVAETVADLIMVTRHETHRGPPVQPPEAVISDVDLAILGAGWERFLEYEHQIRREYQAVDDARFTTARSAVLRGFLESPRIYATPFFADRLESPARTNLTAALSRFCPP